MENGKSPGISCRAELLRLIKNMDTNLYRRGANENLDLAPISVGWFMGVGVREDSGALDSDRSLKKLS